MTAVTMRPLAAARIEPQSDPFASFRERIASRCAEHVAAHPRAVDLEARLLYRLHGALTGSATILAGIHSARRFREQLVGEKHLPTADLCRLATEPTREAKAAAYGAISELANAIGYRLEPLDAKSVEAHETLASVAESAGDFGSELARALKDGRVDLAEADAMEPEVAALEACAARARALVAGVRAGAIR